jgi:hypothetical protein
MPIEPIQPETEDVVDETTEVAELDGSAETDGAEEVERQTKGFVMNHSMSRSTR